MHVRRLAALLLGAWIAGSLFMMAVATGNFRTVDRILKAPAPPVAEYIQTLDGESARIFLRHLAAEQNRRYFDQWETAQLALAVALAVTLFFGMNANRIVMGVSGMMLVLVIVQHWLLTPELVLYGKAIEFIAPEEFAAERARFDTYHRAYSILELVKMVLAVGLSVRLLVYRTQQRRRRVRKQIDPVHHADHRGVDR
jgi:membrane protein YdbS with pleckstrin-like domain